MKGIVIALLGALALCTGQEDVKETRVPIAKGIQFVGTDSGGGHSAVIENYYPDLRTIGWNDEFCSSEATGMWLLYEDRNYNDGNTAKDVMWVYGVHYHEDLESFCNEASSIRFAGDHYNWNENGYTMYSQPGFGGFNELYGTRDYKDLLDGTDFTVTNAIIITGRSSWTFYTGKNYGGFCVCFQSTETEGDGNERLDFGLYPDLSSQGYDGILRSVSKGCHIGCPVAKPWSRKKKD